MLCPTSTTGRDVTVSIRTTASSMTSGYRSIEPNAGSRLTAMNGTRFAGLLLTLGVEPDPRVWELCRPAAATGLPILLTQKNSYETATTVHDMDPEVPVDDEELPAPARWSDAPSERSIPGRNSERSEIR